MNATVGPSEARRAKEGASADSAEERKDTTGVNQWRLHFGAVAVLFLAFLTLSSCGYHFTGKGEAFPKDVNSIYVATFVNSSKNVGLEKEISSALRSEFRRRGRVRPVNQRDQADAILSGVVRSFETDVVSVNASDEVLQFRAVLEVDMTLRRRSPNELLWRTERSRIVETYVGARGAVVTTSSSFQRRTLNAEDIPLFTDVQLTETMSRETRVDLVNRFARKMHQKLIEMF
jgi:outer membrane lipopolysaccharide assembly protein LptE/RlpB